ncbi:MAG: ABC transporter permease, partial [Candidatus Methylomirabilis sp.]|nr:ABC transporter permease [Deltaproteobacteria bacterium]
MFAWVIVDIVLWGFIARYLQGVATPGVDFTTALLGAVLIWDFFGRVMYGVTTSFFEDVWSRNFLNLFASPLTVAEYLTGLVATSTATSLVGLGAMLALAAAAFGLSYAAIGALFAPYVATLFLFGVALGVFGVAVVLRFGPAAEWLIWPMPAMLSPFAGVFYPIATLPEWMRGIAWALPPAHVFEGMRAILAGGAPAPGSLAW